MFPWNFLSFGLGMYLGKEAAISFNTIFLFTFLMVYHMIFRFLWDRVGHHLSVQAEAF